MKQLRKSIGWVVIWGALAVLPLTANAYGMYGMSPVYAGMYGMSPMYGRMDSIYHLYSMYGPYSMQGNSMYIISGMYPMEGYLDNLKKMMYSMYGMFPSMLGMNGMQGMMPIPVSMLSMFPMYGMTTMYSSSMVWLPMLVCTVWHRCMAN